ncbi:MAG: prolyl oligopeptidase family serine peptidase [Bacteroidota bacterium]
MIRFLIASICFLLYTSIYAQPARTNVSSLSIEQIMQGEKFVGHLPANIRWSADSKTLYFSWNPDNDTLRNDYKLNISADGVSSKPERVSIEEQKNNATGGTYNRDRTKMVYSRNGDLFIHNIPENSVRQITSTNEIERRPRFSGDESKIFFQKQNNLFAWDMGTGMLVQLTDFKKGTKKSDRQKSEQDEWLEDDQLDMFEVLAERKMKADTRNRRRDLLKPKRPKTYYYGKKSISNLTIAPDGKFITFRLTKRGEGAETKVPNYVTASGKVENITARVKVGSPVDETELGIYDLESDSIFMIDPTQIEGILDKPDFLKDYWPDSLPYEVKYKKPRPVVFHGPIFSEDGKALVSAKAQDNKDRWLMLVDLPTGKLTMLDRQHDEAWIGGPGISNWNFAPGSMGWLADNRHIWYQSEETGYSHLYVMDVETGMKKALTSGNFEILNTQLSNDKKSFFITSNKESPFEHHFYKMSVEGGEMTQITFQPGNHEVTMSPDEKWLAIRYSYSNKPWELYLMPNTPMATMQQETVSTTEEFRSYKWRDPEIIQFTASDGVKVPARLYRPSAGNKNGAAVIFVHGAGYLQNVHRWWSNYYREFMFHNILADNGYTVLDIDYRGSRGYGRDWRTAIYRHMGGKDLSDQVDGAKYLVEEHGIDAHRIGIYGGSYGGFITLMGMFTSPGTFKSGAALRSVTDWAHYNHPYSANILNTPVEDSIAYRRSSPIYHAEGLEGQLLILHGMIDDNVQFQDVVRLAQRLIELGKDDWEFAVFPLERHGFMEPSSWADEYKRIYKLFYETLLE